MSEELKPCPFCGEDSWSGRIVMSDLNREQVEILKHTIRIGRPFCGSGVDMDGLVGGGYMVCIGRKPFVPEPYYEITREGRLYTPPEDKP